MSAAWAERMGARTAAARAAEKRIVRSELERAEKKGSGIWGNGAG
jgi:hypothetical protein